MSSLNFNNFVRGFVILDATNAICFPEEDINSNFDAVKLTVMCAYLSYGRVSPKVKPNMRKHWGECWI